MEHIAGHAEAPLPQKRRCSRSCFPQEHVGHVLAVVSNLCGPRHPGPPTERRQKIAPCDNRGITDAAARPLPRPTNYQRNATPAFVKAALATAEWAGRADAAVPGGRDVDVF